MPMYSREIVPFSVNPITNQMEVEIFVNNDTIPYNFVIDTGASEVFANSKCERLVRLLKLCETDKVENTYSTTEVLKTRNDNTLTFGNLVCDSIQIVCDADPYGKYDGIIGLSLLK